MPGVQCTVDKPSVHHEQAAPHHNTYRCTVTSNSEILNKTQIAQECACRARRAQYTGSVVLSDGQSAEIDPLAASAEKSENWLQEPTRMLFNATAGTSTGGKTFGARCTEASG